jgi:membrane associated rhomboid family serine protease
MADVFSPTGSVPRPVKFLLIANISIFLLDLLTKGRYFNEWMALDPSKVTGEFQVWRMASYMFVHSISGSFFHILLNMLLLWMFGSSVAETMGERKFLWFYLSSGVFAGLCSLVYYTITGSPTPIIGASGALFALMVAFAVYFPTQQILILFLFPVQARYAVLIFGALALVSLIGGDPNDPIAHATHLGGAVFAWGYFRFESRGAEWLESWRNRKAESAVKAVRKVQEADEKVMVDIDPILKKISQSGMGSLTKEEKEKLEKASELKRKQKSKIISLDDYRKRQ